jgi:hypothetical protein
MTRLPSLGLSLLAAAAVLIGLGCGGGDVTTPPTTGTMEITTATTGPEPDGDGYTVKIDGGAESAIGTGATLRREDLGAGNHSVELEGLAANCTVAGDNPRTVTVVAGATATVEFTITCVTSLPITGSLEITTSTTGAILDPDGYTVKVDQAADQPIAINAAVTVSSLTAGTHSVELAGLAANCSLEGENPRQVTVTAGQKGTVSFQVSCPLLHVARWTMMESGTSRGLAKVWISDHVEPLAGFGVGRDGLFSLSTDGWSKQVLEQPWAVRDVWGRSAHEVFAAGSVSDPSGQAYRGVLLRQDDAGWREISGPTFPEEWEIDNWNFTTMWGSGTHIFAAADWFGPPDSRRDGGLIAHYDGTVWSTTGAGFIYDISGTSPSDVYAVGEVGSDTYESVGYVQHYDGATWSKVLERNMGGATSMSGVWAGSPTSVFVTGLEYGLNSNDFAGIVWHYDGTSWTEIFHEDGLELTAIWGSSPDDVFVVGTRGTILHYNGISWTRQSVPTDKTLLGIWGRAPWDVYVVGQGGTILHGVP